MSKVWFILGSFAFITVVTQIGALMGSTIVENAPDSPTLPDAPTVWNYITWPISNVIYFIQLMTISSAYAFVGAITLIIVVALIWAVLELIRGV